MLGINLYGTEIFDKYISDETKEYFKNLFASMPRNKNKDYYYSNEAKLLELYGHKNFFLITNCKLVKVSEDCEKIYDLYKTDKDNSYIGFYSLDNLLSEGCSEMVDDSICYNPEIILPSEQGCHIGGHNKGFVVIQ